jgi:hypothetical protein
MAAVETGSSGRPGNRPARAEVPSAAAEMTTTKMAAADVAASKVPATTMSTAAMTAATMPTATSGRVGRARQRDGKNYDRQESEF